MNVVVLAFVAGAAVCMLSAVAGYVAHMYASHPLERSMARELRNQREDESDV